MELEKLRNLPRIVQKIRLKRERYNPISEIVASLDRIQIFLPEEKDKLGTWITKPDLSDLRDLTERSKLFLRLDRNDYQNPELVFERVESGIVHVSLKTNERSINFLVDKLQRKTVCFSTVCQDGGWLNRDIGLLDNGLEDLVVLSRIGDKLTKGI